MRLLSITIVLITFFAIPVQSFTYVLGGQTYCRKKTNGFAFIAETYDNQSLTLYTIYAKKGKTWIEPSRRAKVTTDDVGNPIVFMFETSEFAETWWELTTGQALLENVSWERLLRFCEGLDY